MGGFQECCSLALAVSIIVPVRASPSLLWDVVTDFEAWPQIVDTVHDIKIMQKPSSSLHSPTVSNSSASSTRSKVIVGMQICEGRKIKHRVVTLRHVVTNIVENPDKYEYAISFNTYFDKEFPKSADFLCNTSTLSIVAPATSSAAPSFCELIGSCAVEYGGAGRGGLTSCCFYCPFLLNRFCTRRFERHAERKFAKELQDLASEAERRAKLTEQEGPT
jgi:hypothetical protein